MVELRKRKAPATPPPEPPAKKQQPKPRKAAAAAAAAAAEAKTTKAKEEAVVPAAEPAPAPAKKASNGTAKAAAAASGGGKPAEGHTITLDGFGGEIETNSGVKTTLKALVEQSEAGVVLFTYPRANTPGCTTQACLFRDSYEAIRAGGLAVYGLSRDSPKSNTSFQTKQKLPYELLCDPAGTLIAAIGMKKAPANTQRGVFVVDKAGKVLACAPGGPAATLEVVKELLGKMASSGGGGGGDGGDAAPPADGKDRDETEKTAAEEGGAVNGQGEEEDGEHEADGDHKDE